MKIELTGNPFVDTGLAVIAALRGHRKITELTTDDLSAVYGDGSALADRNSKLKSMTMIFTVNSLLTHPGSSETDRKDRYKAIIRAFLVNIGKETLVERCESCGNEKSLDLDKIACSVLVPLGMNPDERTTGRDWFPLIGSLGSDAQALPSASRSINLCAKCLFTVHYMTLGTKLMNGKLIVMQSISTQFWYELIREFVEEYNSRIALGNYETAGKREGNISVIRSILNVIQRMRRQGVTIQHGAALFLWLFSNSGQEPSCEIGEIPNKSLRFLQRVSDEGLGAEIGSLISSEKSSRGSLLESISRGVNYYKLFPTKKTSGVSPEFFKLYQTIVMEKSESQLNTAAKIASFVKEELGKNNPKKLKELMKKDLEMDYGLKTQIKRIIVEMIQQKKLVADEYVMLFPYVGDSIQVSNDGWKLLRYYLHNDTAISTKQKIDMHIYDNVKTLAELIYDDFIQQKGLGRFQNEVLEGVKRNKISMWWLQNQFLKLAISNPTINYDEWKRLTTNSQNKNLVFELIYQLRLLWTEITAYNRLPKKEGIVLDVVFQDNDDLPNEIVDAVSLLTVKLMDTLGRERFYEDVITPLRKNEIGLGWIRKKIHPLLKDDEAWNDFCTNSNGLPFKSFRKFQVLLLISNIYQNHYKEKVLVR
jgi:hypothetical protein